MKYLEFWIVAVFILQIRVDAYKFKRRIIVGPKFLSTDTEQIFKEKIRNYKAATLQSTFAEIDDIHDRAENTFAGISTSSTYRANMMLTNLNEHFRKYRDAYDRSKNHPNTPGCLTENYNDLENSITALNMRILECRDSAITEMKLIKKEIDSNTVELKHGIKAIVERINQCASPWDRIASPKCAKQKIDQTRKTVNDIQQISQMAHKNVLKRLGVIVEGHKSCSDDIITTAKQEEVRIIGNINNCLQQSV